MVPCMYELAVGGIFFISEEKNKASKCTKENMENGKVKNKVKSHCKSTLSSTFL